MNDEDFKKSVNEAVTSINEALSSIRQTLDQHTDVIENQLLPSVLETERTLKSYADSYKINKQNIERVDTRLTAVEEKLDLDVPEDLKVSHFSE